MTSVSAKHVIQKIAYDHIQNNIYIDETLNGAHIDLSNISIRNILPHIDVTYGQVVQSLTFFSGVIQVRKSV